MKLQNSYVMNPIQWWSSPTSLEVNELIEHVNIQILQAESGKHKLYIENYNTSTDDLTEEITFCLNDWRNYNYTLFWTVQVEISDIMQFIEDNYNLEYLESTAGDWFNDNERDVCKDYLESLTSFEEVKFI